MTNQVIIYQQDNGGVAVIRPTEEALILLGIDVIAQKDVPEGKPYKIINASDVPADRSARNAWEIDGAELIDGLGADFGAGSAYQVISYANDGKPIVRHVDFDAAAEHGFDEIGSVHYQWWIAPDTGVKMGVPA